MKTYVRNETRRKVSRKWKEYEALSEEGKSYYDEAIRCGAEHEDALEAASFAPVKKVTK
jgi:hypothetical protein